MSINPRLLGTRFACVGNRTQNNTQKNCLLYVITLNTIRQPASKSPAICGTYDTVLDYIRLPTGTEDWSRTSTTVMVTGT